ncbi:protein YgfX [Nitrincola sp. A-D6]|uniref:protein YgfX n=1 Tax=Nitrincola sp. A-D6 TaxID=1545442 RepID=UPI003FA60F95
MLVAAVPLLLKLGGVLLCVVSLWRSLHEILAGDNYITALSCCPDEGWLQVYSRKGSVFNIECINHYASLPFLLVLSVCDDRGRRHWFLLPRDAISFNQFRRLRVFLMYHRTLPNQARQSSVEQ